MKNKSGFTLVEVVITVAVISIIAAIATPTYLSQKRKGHRAEIINALGQISIEMNRCYADRGGYTCCNDALILPLVLDTPPVTDRGHFSISIAATNSGGFPACKDHQGFTITAIALGDQSNDTNCTTFTIDNMGNQAGGDTSCWGKQ